MMKGFFDKIVPRRPERLEHGAFDKIILGLSAKLFKEFKSFRTFKI